MPALLDRLSGRPLVLATGCGVRETGGNEIERPAGVSLSAAQCRGFIGYLAYKACGIESDIGSETLAKYRRVEREYGIVAADLFGGEAGLQVIGRLDFETGREVLRVA